MEEKHFVSIITPSLNQGQFIEETILSVKNQSCQNIEHIIVDGGSTDGTLDIIRKYEGTYNMRWISEQDSGQADAIEKGFKMAKGSILAWLNSDDYYLHNQVVRKVTDYFDLYRKIHVLTANGYLVNKEGIFLSPVCLKPSKVTLNGMKRADYMLQPSTFFRREVLDRVQFNKGYTYTFDWLFFLEIFKKNYNVLTANDFLSAYRLHDNHKTGLDNASRKLEIAQIARENFGLLSLQGIYTHGIYLLYRLIETLPASAQHRIKKAVTRLTQVIEAISFGRFTT